VKHSTSSLITAVKDHASACYSQGWDEVLETLDDYEILELIGNARTPAGAIRKVAEYFDLSPVPLTGWIVITRDVDGKSVKSFRTREAAAARYEEMAGSPPKDIFFSSAVSDFGTVVTLQEA
jgi:hypothetical protein